LAWWSEPGHGVGRLRKTLKLLGDSADTILTIEGVVVGLDVGVVLGLCIT
jgi:hypothetical protein